MRTAALLLLLVAVCHAELDFRNVQPLALVRSLATRAIGDKLKSVIESFKDIMKTGNSTLGIPQLDPFTLDRQEFDVEHQYATAKGELENLIVNGLSDYTVQDANFKFSKWTMSLDMLWSAVDAHSKYFLDGMVANKVPVYGSGDFYVAANNFRFATETKMKVNYKTKKVQIESFNNTIISVEKVKVDITGLYNKDDFSAMLSAVISDIIPETLDDFQEEVTTEVNKMLIEQLNPVLDQYSLDQIIKLIS